MGETPLGEAPLGGGPGRGGDSESIKKIRRELETRIEKLEGDLRQTLEKLEANQKGVIPPQLKTEVDGLVKNLEEKIRQVSEELKIKGPPGHSPLTLLFENLKGLLNPLSLESLRKILIGFWYGNGANADYKVDDFGMDPLFCQKVRPLFDFLYNTYWRVSVSGLQHIPNEGRGLVVANHSGTLPYDGAMIRMSVENDHPSRRDVRFLVEDFVYHFPFLGTFMYRTGGVRACQENAERLLQNEQLVAVFPEGVKGIGKHFKHRYRLQRFGRGGFIKLALRTGSPIIPTAVIGAEEIHPIIYKSTLLAKPLGIPYLPITPTLPWLGLFGLIPFPSKWSIHFGGPILFEEYGPKDADDQLLVNKLSEMVREKIQAMIVEALKNRSSVLFG
ncbi:MAG: acyltransferase family protein [Deltaproteobacteria bacterium]|nr:acyltransferase family protein [Deltaproteobacteria bacterium]